MAVSMNAGMRADMMISDAMLPQRMAELAEMAEEQAGEFAKLLGDIGDTKGELAAELTQTAQKYSDMKKAGEAAIYHDKETGQPLPDDPRKLVRLVLSGKVKIENIPEELITPEFLRLLMLMSKAKEFGKKDEDDEDEDDNSYLTEAIAAEQKFQQEISYMMLKEFYEIIEKHNERESEKKVTMLDGISEPIDETETLPSLLTAEDHKEADEGIFTELIDNLVETVTEGLEEVSEAVAEAAPNMDVFVPSGSVEVPETEAAPEMAVQSVQEAPTAQYVRAQTPEAAEVTEIAADDVQTVQYVRNDIPQDVKVDVKTPDAPETTVQSAEANVETPKYEAPEASEQMTAQTAVSQNEQTVETAAQQTIPVEQFTVRTVKTEKPEVAENVIQQQEVEEPVVVKTVTRNENAQQLDRMPEKAPEEAPKSLEPRTERVKSAAEEFEMLRNAKAKAAGRFTAEEKVEVKTEIKTEPKPATTAHPLNTDQPIVFKKADGTEIEVRPSEVIKQTAKLIETAVKENDDRTEYSITLNPEELGKITVKLTKAADGAVSVTIAAENARTQRILEQHSDLMQSNLRSNGVDLESWQTVGERQQETMAQDYNGSSKNPYFRNDEQNAEDNSDDRSFADIIASM
ncbi:MAG: flagellar hook-length control protein FliK [Oscillospiraceae bacterium]|nr:flagellar hook-length control protein FliK [Oscillospiraceae bacterium]